MTQWLERREKIWRHSDYIEWRLRDSYPVLRAHWAPPGLYVSRTLKMAKHPSTKRVSFEKLKTQHGASLFRVALSRFILSLRSPELRGIRFENTAEWLSLGCDSVSIYHRIKFLHQDLYSGISSTADSIHVQPSRTTKRRHTISGRFDTALICVSNNNQVRNIHTGLSGILCYDICTE